MANCKAAPPLHAALILSAAKCCTICNVHCSTTCLPLANCPSYLPSCATQIFGYCATATVRLAFVHATSFFRYFRCSNIFIVLWHDILIKIAAVDEAKALGENQLLRKAMHLYNILSASCCNLISNTFSLIWQCKQLRIAYTLLLTAFNVCLSPT